MAETIDRNRQTQKTDWFRIITDLQSAGIPMLRIGESMGGVQLTHQMLVHYRAGTEPLHWRGEQLLNFWCATLDKHRDDRPMTEILKGRYRVVGLRPSHPMANQALIEIRDSRPENAQPALASEVIKRKPGRPRKAA